MPTGPWDSARSMKSSAKPEPKASVGLDDDLGDDSRTPAPEERVEMQVGHDDNERASGPGREAAPRSDASDGMAPIDGMDGMDAIDGIAREAANQVELPELPELPVTPPARRSSGGRRKSSTRSRAGLEPNNVRKLRQEAMMSKAELARRAGVSPLTIDRVEAGCPCRMDTKRKILEALGLKPSARTEVWPDIDAQS